MKSEDEPPQETMKSDAPTKRRKWPWVVGLLLLLAFCDDDDKDRKKKYCYTFGEDKRLCFPKPLPEDEYCYLEADDKVRCYDRKK